MTHIHIDTKKDGFYGAYWECHTPSDRVIIAMLGDDPEDYMAKCAVKWLLRLGVNVLTMSPAKNATTITIILSKGWKPQFLGQKNTAIESLALPVRQQQARLRLPRLRLFPMFLLQSQ